MGDTYSEFDRDALDVRPLAERTSDMDMGNVLEVGERPIPFDHPNLPSLAGAMVSEMERAWELRVPLKVDVGRGRDWIEAH